LRLESESEKISKGFWKIARTEDLNPDIQKKYQRDEILGASPEKLVVLLYDGAIRNVEDARKKREEKDPFEFTQHLTKAEAIVAELTGSLKVELLGEAGPNLLRLYDFVYGELIEAQRDKSDARLEGVVKILKQMRATWLETLERSKEESVDGVGAESSEQAPVRRPSFSLEA
jgi:flagellar secretion chaperone FliS